MTDSENPNKSRQYKEKTTKPKFVEKGTKYVEKGEQNVEKREQTTYVEKTVKKTGQWVEKKTNNTKYREVDTGGYDYDSSNITEATVVPKLPKKEELIPVPQETDFKAREQVLLDQISLLKDKRRGVHNSKFVREKTNQGETQDLSAGAQFDGELEEVRALREKRLKLLNEIRPRKDELQKVNEQFQNIKQQLKNLQSTGRNNNKEDLEYRLESLKSRLLKGALSPKQEKALNHQIQNLKKSVTGAKPYEETQVKIRMLEERKAQLGQRIDKLIKQKKPFVDQFDSINKIYLAQEDKIKALKDQMTLDNKNRQSEKVKVDKDRDDFKQTKLDQKKEIDDEIDKVYDQIDLVWDEYDKKIEQQKKQQHYIDHINWMNKQKQYLVEKKEREEKRKQWEEREKEREKEREEREKNRPRKYTPQVNNCQFLISYCDRLKPREIFNEVKVEKEREKLTPEEIEQKLNNQQQWKKEKGVSLIQSKKTRQSDQPIKSKKVKRIEVQIEKPQEPVNYSHEFSILTLFEDVKTQPPQKAEDLEKTIKQLQERKQYFEKMNEDQSSIVPIQKAHYKVKEEDETRQNQQPRNRNQNNNYNQRLKVKVQDFPTL